MNGMISRPLWHNGWMYRHRGELTTPIVIDSNLKDITSSVAALPLSIQVNGQPMFYDGANNVFRVLPEIALYYAIEVIVTGSGTFANNSSASSYEFSLLRPDGVTKIRSYIFDRPDGLPLSFTFDELFDAKTFVFSGGSDPYQLDGFKVGVQKLSGADLTLDGEQEFRFIGQ